MKIRRFHVLVLICHLFSITNSALATNYSDSNPNTDVHETFELLGEVWNAVYSQEHEKIYYHNTVSFSSQWLDPRLEGADPEERTTSR